MQKRCKKIIILVSMIFLTFIIAACANNAQDDQGAGNEQEGKDGLKIAIVTSPSGVDDKSFNQNNYEGILAFIEEHPDATVKAVREPTGDPAASVQAVADIVADYDVIVTPGFQFAGISQLAIENPDKKFILVDSEPTPVGDQTEFDNVYAMNFAEQESGFFAGVAAALESKTKKVAVVNGIAYPSNVNYQFGFESGVNHANKHLGTNVEIIELPGYSGTDVNGNDVGGNYVGTFSDPATGKTLGNMLIDQGVDIIFSAAGGSGSGVITAAKEAKGDIKIIGVDVDQYDEGQVGDKNVILTSAVKVMDLNVKRQLEAIVNGTFKGGNVVLYADTDSTGYVKKEGRHQLSEDTLAKLEEVYQLVKEKKIVPASNFNGHTPENFPGL